MLRKLDREIDRFQNADNSVETMIDAAFNAAVTAWHLCDWVFADLTKAQRDRLQIKSLGQLQEHARTCRALYLCQYAATASKHWKVTHYPDPSVGVIVTATPIP